MHDMLVLAPVPLQIDDAKQIKESANIFRQASLLYLHEAQCHFLLKLNALPSAYMVKLGHMCPMSIPQGMMVKLVQLSFRQLHSSCHCRKPRCTSLGWQTSGQWIWTCSSGCTCAWTPQNSCRFSSMSSSLTRCPSMRKRCPCRAPSSKCRPLGGGEGGGCGGFSLTGLTCSLKVELARQGLFIGDLFVAFRFGMVR